MRDLPAPSRLSRRLIVGTLVLVLLGSVFVPTTTALVAPTRRALRVTWLVNNAREAYGLPRLPISYVLSKIARRHSRQMAEREILFHGDLARLLSRYDFELAVDNVGAGKRLSSIVRGFLGSPTHAAHIFDPRWRLTGVGVVRSESWIWVTQIFYT